MLLHGREADHGQQHLHGTAPRRDLRFAPGTRIVLAASLDGTNNDKTAREAS
jgi:hypothetical protein